MLRGSLLALKHNLDIFIFRKQQKILGGVWEGGFEVGGNLTTRVPLQSLILIVSESDTAHSCSGFRFVI